MIITLIDVSEPATTKTARGQYQSLEVSYKNEQGQVQGKKIMSFANPAVFKSIQEFTKGDRLDVETFKDDNGYWQWKSVSLEGEGPVATAQVGTPAKAGTKVVGSNYETSDERARRQVLIVRQSSLSNAVDILSVGAKSLDKAAVLSLAEELEQWVLRTDVVKGLGGIDEMDSDIPY